MLPNTRRVWVCTSPSTGWYVSGSRLVAPAMKSTSPARMPHEYGSAGDCSPGGVMISVSSGVATAEI